MSLKLHQTILKQNLKEHLTLQICLHIIDGTHKTVDLEEPKFS